MLKDIFKTAKHKKEMQEVKKDPSNCVEYNQEVKNALADIFEYKKEEPGYLLGYEHGISDGYNADTKDETEYEDLYSPSGDVEEYDRGYFIGYQEGLWDW